MTDHRLSATRVDAPIGVIVTGTCTACPWHALRVWPEPWKAMELVRAAHVLAHAAGDRQRLATAQQSTNGPQMAQDRHQMPQDAQTGT